VETWSTSQTVVLETTIIPLGTVIGLHGTNAIIMTSRHTDPLLFRTEWKQYRRMFSEGGLASINALKHGANDGNFGEKKLIIIMMNSLYRHIYFVFVMKDFV
jgi:hypothetical protein